MFGGFGQQQQQQQNQGNPLFGGAANTNTTGGFGASSSSGFGAFGQQQQQPQSNTGGFGTGGFGVQSNTASSGFLGASRPAVGGFGSSSVGGFGSSNPSQPQTSAFGASSSFGQQQQPVATSGGFGFGAAAPTASTGFGGAGSTTMGTMNLGTGNPAYQATMETDTNGSATNFYLQSISAMPAYAAKSFEELRLEDYQAGRKFATQKGFGVSSGFGASNTAATSSAFGRPTVMTTGATSGGLFGASTTGTTGGFGSGTTGAFGQSNSAFGASNAFGSTGSTGFGTASTTTTGFGSSFGQQPATMGFGQQATTGGFGTGATTSAFGQQPAATGGFGSSTSGFGQTAGTGFGAPATASAFGQPTSTGFGASAASGTAFGQQASSGFGSAFGAANKPATGLFGQPQATSAFGATGGFGSSAATTAPTATTGLFGQQQPQQQSSLFGGGAASAASGFKPAFGMGQGTGSVFGQPQQQQQQPQGFGGFGQQPTATTAAGTTGGLFGTAGGSGLFGSAAPQTTVASTGATGQFGFGTQQPAQTGLFGQSLGAAPATTAATGTGLFGSSIGSSGMFGAAATTSAPTSSIGLFGSSGAAAPATSTGLFGSSTMTQPAGGLFGQKPATLGGGGGGLFGTAAAPAATSAPSAFGAGGSLFGNTAGGVGSSLTAPAATSSLFSGATPQKVTGTVVPTIDSKPFGSSPLFSTSSAPSAATDLTPSKLTLSARRFAPKSVAKFKPRVSSSLSGTPSYANGHELFKDTVASATPSRTPLTPAKFSTPASLDYRHRLGEDSITKSAKALITRSSVKELVILDGDNSVGHPGKSASKNAQSDMRSPILQEDSNVGSFSTPLAAKSTKVLQDMKTTSLEAPPYESPFKPFVPSSSSDYTSSPSLKELQKMGMKELRSISEFRVTRKGYGSILFLRPVDISAFHSDLASVVCGTIVSFGLKEVTVYPDESIKPPVGQGLNVPARITLENCWPKGGDASFQESPNAKEMISRQIDRLKSIPETRFISYAHESGWWTFEVEHFTRYGLDDDDEDEHGEIKASAIKAKAISSAKKGAVMEGDNEFEYVMYEVSGEESFEVAEDELMEKSDGELIAIEEDGGEEDQEEEQHAKKVPENEEMVLDQKQFKKDDAKGLGEKLLPQTPYFQRYHSKDSSILPRQLGLSAQRIQSMQAGLFHHNSVEKRATGPSSFNSPTTLNRSPKRSANKEDRIEGDDRSLKRDKVDHIESHVPIIPLVTIKPVRYEDSVRFGREGSYRNMGFSMGSSFGGCFSSKGNIFIVPSNNGSRFEIKTFTLSDATLTASGGNDQEKITLFQDQKEKTSSSELGFFESCRLEFSLMNRGLVQTSSSPYLVFQMESKKEGIKFHDIVAYQRKRAEEFEKQNNGNLPRKFKEDSFEALWDLCSALFDESVPGLELKESPDRKRFNSIARRNRKELLIKHFTSKRFTPKITGSAPMKILQHLLSYGISEAADEAMRSGYPRLAMLLCQVPGSLDFKTLIRDQVRKWREQNIRINPIILCIYDLMSGSVSSTLELLKSSNDLNWMIAFCLYLCYEIDEWDSWYKAYDLFQRETALLPDMERDIQGCLIKFAANPSSIKFETLFNPEKYSKAGCSSPNEAPFFLFQMLVANNIGKPHDNAFLTVYHGLIQNYADELLNRNQPAHSLFVMLHRKEGGKERDTALFSYLCQVIVPCISSEANREFVLGELKVSPSEYNRALAYQSMYDNDSPADVFSLFVGAESWSEAHAFLFSLNWFFKSIISKQYLEIYGYLIQLKAQSHLIDNWAQKGQIFLQFIEIMNSSNVTLEVYSKMASALEILATSGNMPEMKKICCMEMATRLFGLLKSANFLDPLHRKDSLVLSDAKLSWIKKVSFSYFD